MKIYKSDMTSRILFKEAKRKRFYGSGYGETYNIIKGNTLKRNQDKISFTVKTSSHSDIDGVIKELKDKFGLVGSKDDYFYNIDEYYDISLDGYVDYNGQRAFVSLGLFFENSDDPLTAEDAEQMDDLEIVDSNTDISNHYYRW